MSTFCSPFPASELNGAQLGETIRVRVIGSTIVEDELIEVRHFRERDEKAKVWIRLRNVAQSSDFARMNFEGSSGFFISQSEQVQVKF